MQGEVGYCEDIMFIRKIPENLLPITAYGKTSQREENIVPADVTCRCN